jgi:hypothetical protein
LFVYPIITPRNSLNILSTLIYSTILKLGWGEETGVCRGRMWVTTLLFVMK